VSQFSFFTLDDCKTHFHQYFTKLFEAEEDSPNDFGVGKILPSQDCSVFSYKLDVVTGHWILWRDALPSIPGSFDGPRIIISNESVAIQHFFIKTYSNGNVPVLILGPASVGKSQVTQFAIEDLPKDRFVHNNVHVTPVTTSSSLLNSIMIGLDRRRKGVYGPALGRRCVLFVDDIITSDPAEGNIRTPSELLRHWLNYECVFDGKAASKMELVDIVRLNFQLYFRIVFLRILSLFSV
jgi:dynein heavy chain